jgi:hypothetical protein
MITTPIGILGNYMPINSHAAAQINPNKGTPHIGFG